MEEPTPLLASEAPTVSDDGKTITYKLRDDVMFSPPAGWGPELEARRTAADVKYAIERSLLPGVAERLRAELPSGVVGMPEAIKAAQDNPTAALPTSAGSPRRTTRRW